MHNIILHVSDFRVEVYNNLRLEQPAAAQIHYQQSVERSVTAPRFRKSKRTTFGLNNAGAHRRALWNVLRNTTTTVYICLVR